ncbi:MAG TPA: RHS repeat-associated core domain-containing protein [Pyrinomonadaceae bacterium]|nr:RHS repeat-associated core domain-containing protein [Pyrinomonadaceae bacterium]
MKTSELFLKQKSLNWQKNSAFYLILTLLLLTSFTNAFGQSQPKNPDRGAKVGNAYSVGDFETINTTNGNLMLNFPLASLPAGRGEVGAGINLIYSSKLYDTRTEKIKDSRYQCVWQTEGYESCTYYNKTIIEQSNKGGWKYGDVYRIELEDRRTQYGQTPPECRGSMGVTTPAWEEMTWVWKVRIIFPDGSAHDMIPYGYDSRLSDGFFRVKPNGTLENCGGGTTQTSRPVYYSADGTFLRLETTSDNDWTLYFPDGKKVVASTGNPQRVYDRNNNYVEYRGIENYNNTGNFAFQAADQFNRTVTLEYNGAAPGEDAIRVKGFEGADLVWKVKWKTIAAKKYYESCLVPNTCPVEDQNSTLISVMNVIDKITLPTQMGGGTYTFSYNAPNYSVPLQVSNGWGEVSGVILPTGADIAYGYSLDGMGSQQDPQLPEDILRNHPTTKTLAYDREYDGQAPRTTETWNYSTSISGGAVTAPDGSSTTELFYNTAPSTPSWDSGLSYKSIAADGTMTERLWARNIPASCTGCSYYGLPNNPYVKTEFTSIKNSGGSYTLTAIKDYSYDKNGNVTQVSEYDWVSYSSIPRDQYGQITGIPTGITPKRITATSYYAETPDASVTTTDSDLYIWTTSPKLKNTVKSSEVRNGSNQPVSRTEIFYDDEYNTGNPTQTKIWDSFKNGANQPHSNPLSSSNSISTSAVYNSYGMPTETTDARGVKTTFTYGCINGQTSCQSNEQNLYPTKIETASNYTSLKRTATTKYDFFTGLVTLTTDVDNNISTATEYDALGRPTIVKAAVDTPQEVWTQTNYSDSARRIIVRSDLFAPGDGKKVAVQHYDQLGRVRLSRTLEDAATQSATNEEHGIKVQTRYQTTSGAVYTLTSNPFRANYSSNATAEETMGWTRTKEENNGRREETETFSGVALPAPWGSNTNSTGIVIEEEDANATVVTDEAGKKRRTVEDALGRLIRADEPDGNNNLGSIDTPVQATNYSYDALGNLIEIIQGGQTRTFAYSSLSRLRTATNPESGTFQYTYDNNGNLLTKKDARNITTTYTYDALNRVIFRDYSDSTPDITYTYDETSVPKSKGKLTKISSSVSETKYTSFDAEDRVLGSQQIIGGQTYAFGYTYNLDGSLKTQTYPSGKVVKYDYSNDGDLAQVSNNQTQKVYVNSFSYSAHGQVEKMRLGNGKWEATKFNSSLQITEAGLGHSNTDTGLWKAQFEYGDWENGAINAKKNNGNLARQTITVPTIGTATGFTAVQSYTYDQLDRVKSAVETVGGVEKWKQTFDYDRFGNKRLNTAGTTLLSSESNVPKIANPEALTTNNQFKEDQDNDGLPDYLYDASGNLKQDARGRTFTYDAENRQLTAVGTGLSMSYAYDGNDKRVKSFNAATNQTTFFVYDADGQLAAEFTLNTPPPTSPTISYLTTDALGSVRVVSNSFGEIKARRDFLPFGEEIEANIGSRTTSQKYSAIGDDTRKKFATYQRDEETGLDFAQSRYYSPMQGRFTSPDEFKGGPDELFDFEEDASNNPTFYADLTNPQSLNKYQYTYNNPYKYTDEDGHCPVGPCPIPLWMRIFIRPTTKAPTRTQTQPRVPTSTFDLPPGTIIWDDGTIQYPDGTREYPTPSVPSGPPPGAAEAARHQGRTNSNAQPKARPQPVRARGNRDVRKVNQKRAESARKNVEKLKRDLGELNRQQNKTPEDKKKIDRIKKQIKNEEERMKKSETHGKQGKGN